MICSRCAVAVPILLLLASCSSDKVTVREPAELRDFKPAASMELRWRRHVGVGGNAGLLPAVSTKAVYVVNEYGELFRLDAVSGKKIWRLDTGFKISGAVGTGAGLIVVGGLKGELAAFDEDGKSRWITKVSSEVSSAPQIAENMVVVRTSDGRITALSVEDGKRQWLYERSTPTLIVRNHAGVAIQRGVIYAGFAAGKLVAINLASGSVVWESAVSQPRGNTELERISDITSVPVVDADSACAVSFQGRIACFEIRQGAMLWSREISSDKGLTLKSNVIYVSDTEGTVMAMDKASGSTLWKNDQLYLRKPSAPYVVDKYVLVGDYEGYLHVLSREDGNMVARIRTDSSSIPYSPLALGDGLLLQTNDGGIFSIAIK